MEDIEELNRIRANLVHIEVVNEMQADDAKRRFGVIESMIENIRSACDALEKQILKGDINGQGN